MISSCRLISSRRSPRHARSLSNVFYPSVAQAYDNIRDRERGEGGLNAFVHVAPQGSADPEPKPTDARPLAGLPIAIKDTFSTSDMPTTACSDILQEFSPRYSSTPTALLSSAGAHLIGKTSCDEFGMGSHNVNLPRSIRPPRNPASPDRTGSAGEVLGGDDWREREARSCGGSSGGSAAAVAGGMAWAALGTDTGGSTRLPASYCGIVGLKPSYGLISRHGLISYADTLDTVGIMAKEVGDVKKVFDVISQPDPKDPTCHPASIREISAQITSSAISSLPSLDQNRLDGLRIGIPLEAFPSEAHAHLSSPTSPFSQTLRILRDLGATLHSVSTPLAPHALSAYYVMASAEAASNLGRFDGVRFGSRSERDGEGGYEATRGEGFGDEVKKRILVGGFALSAEAYNSYYIPSLLLRKHLTKSYISLFRHAHPFISSLFARSSSGIDLLLQPSTISSAPLLSSLSVPMTTSDSPSTSIPSTSSPYVQDILTVPASLTGFPAMSIPAGKDMDEHGREGWPVGVGMVGFWGGEELMFKVGSVLERALKEQREKVN